MQEQKKTDTKITFSCQGCLTLVILSAIALITIKECKRAELRYQQDQYKYDQMKKANKDSTKISTINYQR